MIRDSERQREIEREKERERERERQTDRESGECKRIREEAECVDGQSDKPLCDSEVKGE